MAAPKSTISRAYEDGRRWKVRVRWADGSSLWVSGTTRDAALTEARAAAARGTRAEVDTEAAAGPTLGKLAERYVAERLDQDAWVPLTAKRVREDLAKLGKLADTPIRRVNGAMLRQFLAQLRREGIPLASMEKRFSTLASLLRWAYTRGHLERQPLDQLDTYDRPWATRRAKRIKGRGKPQLRNSAEARAYIVAAQALPTPQERVAALLPLLQLMRSGEIRHLRACDVDLSAVPPVIHVRDHEESATEPDGWEVKGHSERRLAISPLVLDDLTLLVGQATKPDALLLAAHRPIRGSRGQWSPHKAVWLSALVKSVCAAAGVRIVTTHGLRGTAATILAEAGVQLPDIAKHCGHADRGQTAVGHYVGVGVLERPVELADSRASRG